LLLSSSVDVAYDVCDCVSAIISSSTVWPDFNKRVDACVGAKVLVGFEKSLRPLGISLAGVCGIGSSDRMIFGAGLDSGSCYVLS
jgi:hypothetical protein